jgi:hypothetical protein
MGVNDDRDALVTLAGHARMTWADTQSQRWLRFHHTSV